MSFDESVVVSVVPAFIAGLAAVLDIRSRRIPNALIVAALVLGLGIHVARGGLPGAGLAVGGAVVGGLILFPLYRIRAMGAGDVKLLAALGALVGPQMILWVALYSAIMGGVVAAFMLAQRHQLGISVRRLVARPGRVERSGLKAPYGVAIAGGLYVSMLLSSGLL